jgi:hypothetical protein
VLLLLFLQKLLNGCLFRSGASRELSPHNLSMVHETLIESLLSRVILNGIDKLIITKVLHIKFISDSLVLLADGLFLLLGDAFVAHYPSLE